MIGMRALRASSFALISLCVRWQQQEQPDRQQLEQHRRRHGRHGRSRDRRHRQRRHAGAGHHRVVRPRRGFHAQDHFYDVPYPSDLRLTAQGTPDLTGIPYPSFLTTIAGLVQVAMSTPASRSCPSPYLRLRRGAPRARPVAGHRRGQELDDPPRRRRPRVEHARRARPDGRVTPPSDGWVPDNLLAIAQRPGFVLHPMRKYAFVVMKALGDANKKPLGSPAALEDLKAGKAPAGAKGAAALALDPPLWDTLKMMGVDASGVAAATVFTTGDVVAETADLASKLAAKYTITIDGLAYNAANGAIQNRYCELLATVTYPQFQQGTPPFDTGSFAAAGATASRPSSGRGRARHHHVAVRPDAGERLPPRHVLPRLRRLQHGGRGPRHVGAQHRQLRPRDRTRRRRRPTDGTAPRAATWATPGA